MTNIFSGPKAKRNGFLAGGGVLIILAALCFAAYVATSKPNDQADRKTTKTTQKSVTVEPTITPKDKKQHDHSYHKSANQTILKKKKVDQKPAQPTDTKHDDIVTSTENPVTTTWSTTPIPTKSTTYSTTPIPGRTTTYTTTPIPGKSGTRRYA